MSKKKRGPGAPAGNRNNPHGRPPSVGAGAVEKVFARLDSKTVTMLEALESKWSESRSGAIRRCIVETGAREGIK